LLGSALTTWISDTGYEGRGKTTSADLERAESVLVLGSGGLIGSALTTWLESKGYSVLHVRNRKHIDLTRPGSLDSFEDANVAFAFFLACEVGGSKFINSNDTDIQMKIIENNMRMYHVVFPWLQRRAIPFVFASSYLEFQVSPM